VATWDAFLGNESSNNWAGWFNSSGAVTTTSGVQSAGSILEGALTVESVFGEIPATVYVAVGKYQSQDGGTLQAQVPAGNGNGNIEAAEWLPFRLDSVLSAPAAPALLAPADDSSGAPLSLTLRWARTSGAVSYGLQVSTDSLFGGGFAANLTGLADTQRTVSGLSQNARYFWRAQARNPGGNSPWSPVRRFTTLLLPPAQVQLVSPPDNATTPEDTVFLLWRTSSVLVSGYRLDVGGDSLFSAVVLDTTVTDTTYRLLSLVPDQRLWWRVRAENAGGTGPASAVRSFTPVEGFTTVALGWQSGWDLVSLPVETTADSVHRVFPQSLLSSAFSFQADGGYTPESRLRAGAGYWTKFGAAGSGSISGRGVAADTIEVEAGWNLVGSISVPVDTADVQQIPAGILVSGFFAYGAGYEPAATILPGKAYWVKAAGTGSIVLREVSGVVVRQKSDPAGESFLRLPQLTP
jgi:hypothetical protein